MVNGEWQVNQTIHNSPLTIDDQNQLFDFTSFSSSFVLIA